MTRLLLNLIGKHQGEVRMRGKKRINFFPSFLRCMGGKQGANPSGGEKDIASPLYLLYIYDKAERESISLKEIEELLRKNGL